MRPARGSERRDFGRAPARVLTAAAAAGYTVNCLLGAAVAARLVDTRSFRWVHHALFISTIVLCSAAALSLAVNRNRALLVLLPAAVPFAAVPRVRARSRKHPLVALAAAPFVLGALVKVWR